MKNYIRLARPEQWIKNLFIFAALIFSKNLVDTDKLRLSVFAFVAFSLSASFIYVINDILDAPADRLHPVKRNRPIASGKINQKNALIFAFAILFLAALPTIKLPAKSIIIILAYVIIMTGYSVKLKHIVLVDIFIIAVGFMLRVLVGAYAIDVYVSKWLIITTLFLSLFLAVSKRKLEMSLESNPERHRKVLTEYDTKLIDQMITITGSGAIISYALYSISRRTVEMFKTELLIYTTIFVIYGIFRYIYLLNKNTSSETPANLIINDPPMLVNLLLWILSCIIIIYRTIFINFLK